jgi:Aspartyl protease
VENNPRAAYKRQRVPKKQYLDMIQDNTDPETVFGEVMKQLVTIKLQDLLACSLAFTKLLFKGVPVQAEVLTASVGSIRTRQRTEQAYAAKTPKLLVKVDGVPTQAMLDTRAEVNVITRAAADELGLPVRTDLLLALKAVSGETWAFDRACEDVEIDIGGVVNH